MITNDTAQTFQLRLRVGEERLEGEWRCDYEPYVRYRIVERDHEIRPEFFGGATRPHKPYPQQVPASLVSVFPTPGAPPAEGCTSSARGSPPPAPPTAPPPPGCYCGRFDYAVGGGLCQLSNLLFWMTLHTAWEAWT